MYSVTQFLDRQMMAVSVSPPVNEQLSDDFQELARIHFYLGHAPIDFMIEAVEKASLQEIEKGKIPIYFATKEIQEFLADMTLGVSFGYEKFNTATYFNTSFKGILNHTVEVLDSAYNSPKKKHNFEAVQTMVSLTHEVVFLKEHLHEVGVETESVQDLVDMVKTKYQKVQALNTHYDNLANLKDFDSYKKAAQDSVINQLNQKYEFNYASFAKIYESHDGDWIHTLSYLLKEQKDINTNPEYKFNEKESQELKDSFLTQVKSFNRLLQNGVVNYVLSYAAALSRESYQNVNKSRLSAESYYQRELSWLEKNVEREKYSRYHNQAVAELEKFKANKEEFIATKTDDKTFFEKYLTILHRQEKDITQSLDKVRANLINVQGKDTIVFEGDIFEGFVIGKFSNLDKVLLVHKDEFVDVPEAVYAMVVPKEKYEALVSDGKLIFSEEFRNSEFSNASNFWSYGQFLNEITEAKVQRFFLGQEFDLIDNTVAVSPKDLSRSGSKPR